MNYNLEIINQEARLNIKLVEPIFTPPSLSFHYRSTHGCDSMSVGTDPLMYEDGGTRLDGTVN